MTALPLRSLEKNEKAANADVLDFQKTLRGRASSEVVIAFMGAVGCGMPRLIKECAEDLEARGYDVKHIRLSEYIKDELKKRGDEIENPRYLQYQNIGNELRDKNGLDIFASFAINKISRIRAERNPIELSDSSVPVPRVAYLIDQVKHPSEIQLLKLVYRKIFFAVGVMSSAKDRKNRLLDEGIDGCVAEDIMNRDRKEIHKYGQQLEKAFQLADYFVHHPSSHQEETKKQLKRFGDILHGDNKVSPSQQEYAMYVAYSTGLKSACLSRQVGAAIVDKDGNLIATGSNDVPAYKGGLYTEYHETDGRCINRGFCENDFQKNKRRKNIERGLTDFIKSEKSFEDSGVRNTMLLNAEKLVSEVYRLSGVGDLIEFSRAVHAEMDALISLSRGSSGSSVGASLFTTTFPCHNCARHIIAAGIDKVFYVEPYDKSLAFDSHEDAIELLDYDHPGNKAGGTKVQFIHFSGVAPALYADVFLRPDGRKDVHGKFRPSAESFGGTGQQSKIVREYLDSYRAFELKIADMFESGRTGGEDMSSQ